MIPYVNPFAISLSMLGAWVALTVVAWTVARVHRAVLISGLASEPARLVDQRSAPSSDGHRRAA